MSEADALLRCESRAEFINRFGALVTQLEEQLGQSFIRPDRWLCDDVICRYGDAGGSYFADSNHLGRYGIGVVAPMFNNLN